MVRRALDVALALPLTAVAALAVLFAARRPARSRVIAIYGSRGEPVRYRAHRFFSRASMLWPLNHADILRVILRGDLSFVGPRPALLSRPRPRYARFRARPGLVSPHLLQRRVNIGFDTADESDAQLLRALSLRSYAGTLARFVIALALGKSRRQCPDTVRLLDVQIANVTMASAVEWIGEAAVGERFTQVAFVNADCFNVAARDQRYRNLLGRVERVLADGIGIHYALKLFTPFALRENVNGTDMFPRLCRMMEQRGLSLYLLGAKPGVAEAVAAHAAKHFPALRIAGTHHGHLSELERTAMVERINASGADVLLVAMGVPRQEQWIDEHRHLLVPRVAIGVGGLFDFYSGSISRAPLWMREIGLEWSYRLIQEPGRMWRRYIVGNPAFLLRSWIWARSARHGAGRESPITR